MYIASDVFSTSSAPGTKYRNKYPKHYEANESKWVGAGCVVWDDDYIQVNVSLNKIAWQTVTENSYKIYQWSGTKLSSSHFHPLLSGDVLGEVCVQ